MDAELVNTEGFSGYAEVVVHGVRLVVMDSFSVVGEPAEPGWLRDVELSAIELDGSTISTSYASPRRQTK